MYILKEKSHFFLNRNKIKFITEAKDFCVFFDGTYKNKTIKEL